MSEIGNSKSFTVSQHIGGALLFAETMEDCFSKQPIINILEEALLKADKLQSDYTQLKQSAELSISQLNGEKAGLEIERDRLKDAYNHAIFHLYNSSTKQIGFDEFKEKWYDPAGLTDKEVGG